MSLSIAERTALSEPRYSPSAVREVAAVAARLQEEASHEQEQLTARELEAVGAEVGIDPAFIQQALAQIAGQSATARLERSRRIEFGSLVGALALPLIWGGLAYLCGSSHGLAQFSTLIAPAPLSLLLGFVAGRKSAGTAAGISLNVALAPALALMLTRMHSTNVEGPTVLYVMIGSVLLGWLGRVAAGLRAEYFPLPSTRRSVTREELLSLLVDLRAQAEAVEGR